MIDVKDKPQILQHLEKSLNVTVYDTKCVPLSRNLLVGRLHEVESDSTCWYATGVCACLTSRRNCHPRALQHNG